MLRSDVERVLSMLLLELTWVAKILLELEALKVIHF